MNVRTSFVGDHRYNIQLQDPSVDPRDDFFILTIFSAEQLSFGSDLRAGSVILVRDFFVSRKVSIE